MSAPCPLCSRVDGHEPGCPGAAVDDLHKKYEVRWKKPKKSNQNQPSLFDVPTVASPVDRIVAKARLRKIVRGQWGIHAKGGKWKYDGDGCCALGAFLEDVETQRHETSPRATAARVLGVEARDIDAFIRGFDNRGGGSQPELFS